MSLDEEVPPARVPGERGAREEERGEGWEGRRAQSVRAGLTGRGVGIRPIVPSTLAHTPVAARRARAHPQAEPGQREPTRVLSKGVRGDAPPPMARSQPSAGAPPLPRTLSRPTTRLTKPPRSAHVCGRPFVRRRKRLDQRTVLVPAQGGEREATHEQRDDGRQRLGLGPARVVGYVAPDAREPDDEIQEEGDRQGREEGRELDRAPGCGEGEGTLGGGRQRRGRAGRRVPPGRWWA